MNNITIVTYHYVREISGSNYPNIKGLEFSGFKRQLDYLEKNFNIIKPLDLINNWGGGNREAKPPLCIFDYTKIVFSLIDKKMINQ